MGASAQARGFYLHARILVEQGDLEQAREELHRVIRLDPMAPGPWSALAEVDLGIGDPAAAEQAYREALNLGAPWPDRAALVELLLALDALDEAEAELRRWSHIDEALGEGGTMALDELRSRVELARGMR